jgi:hydrogenase-4 component F
LPWIPFGGFFLTILSHTFVLVVLYSPSFLQRIKGAEYDHSKRLFYPALNFYLLANSLVLVVQQFALIWVVLELTTFSLVPLIFFYRSKESLEAVWKYLFLVSLGLVFLFVGVLFLGVSARGVSEYTAFTVARMTEAAPQLQAASGLFQRRAPRYHRNRCGRWWRSFTRRVVASPV